MEYTTAVGQNIARLRKDKEFKQEELANYVGVSAQAVSKWENGGMPDPELLPKIAEFFGTSIDALYGRNIYGTESLWKTLVKNLSCENIHERAFEICTLLIEAMKHDVPDTPPEIDEIDEVTSISTTIQSKSAFAKLFNSMSLRYFILMPELFGKKSNLSDCGYSDLFRDLGDENFFKALEYLTCRESQKPFTNKLFFKQLGFDMETTDTVIKKLVKYNLLSESSAEMDDEKIEIYKLECNADFFAMLALAHGFTSDETPDEESPETDSQKTLKDIKIIYTP